MLTNLSALTAYIPADIDFLSAIQFFGMLAFGVLFVGLLARVVIGKNCSLNHSVSAAMGILCIYLLSIVIDTFDPYGLSQYLSPLPFVTFQEKALQLFVFEGASFQVLCREVLSMVILAFLVNLLDTFIPKGKKVLTWYFWRFVAALTAIFAHYFVTWAFNTYIPGTLAAYAPMILLGLLAGMLFLGLLNVILSVVLTVVNPIIGALYTFFFSNIIGKQISKALVTTGILSGVVYALSHLGYAAISITPAALVAYLPVIAVLLVLWYVIGHLL